MDQQHIAADSPDVGPVPATPDEDAVAAAASRLLAARASGVACAPVRDLISSDDLAAAYAVQERQNRLRIERGARVVGRKIGATSKAVQRQLGVDQPDFGMLFADMEVTEGEAVAAGLLVAPKVEAEVAFVLAEDLAEGPLDADQVRRSVAYAMAAIEIVDSRIRDWDISFADTVADSASSGLYVLGSTRRTLRDLEPRDVAMTMTVDDEIVSTGTGADCLGDPLLAVAWLADRARTFGEPLRAGQVVLSGALGPMRDVRPGSTVTATVRGLGTVTARFADDSTPPSGGSL